MFGRYVVATISALFSLWCGFVSVFTFLGSNQAVYHLPSFYMLGYSAIYAILSPFGLAGILGALHRKKALIRGFLFQYSVAYILLTGMNVVSILLSHRWAQKTLVKCISDAFRPGGRNVGTQACERKVKDAQLTSLVFTCVQGGIMLICGIILLIFGRREFQDIKIDEETSNLLEKSAFASHNNADLLPSEPEDIHRSPSNKSNYNNGLNRNLTINTASSGLSRHTTNSSTHSSRTADNNGQRVYAAPSALPPLKLNRPQNPIHYENHYSRPQTPIHNENHYEYIAKTLASDITRKGLLH
ncbi:10809_t:CDS:2 [Ambispora gerdemannii]|uniref:10809_t:CDS:1 n=1 Tax=Ambispora gerdemannii TaxID=144530 RepID=A0A9N8WST6_9GLOM|nr:10809_t:CDS:2 [Ambispora gerdemannii]